ncbi:MAG: cobalamin-dependent protein [Clostridia bacterium]|nr:cobalamin-dependent protein [Clostridia bacterium]
MNSTMLEYIKGLKPETHLDGRELVKEGISIGRTIKAGKSRFIRESKYSNFLEYKKECTVKGKIYFNMLLGLATLEEQVEAIKEVYEFYKRTGLEVHTIQTIPSGLVALPKAYRDKAPSTTSYLMDGYEDYKVQVEAAPIEVTFNDYHLASPNGLETTIHAIRTGSFIIGEFSQIIWGYPGFDDDVKRFSDMVKSLGIIASKSDEMFVVKTYLDDGFAGYFMDCASYVGYALLEHYICTKLCGARYMIAYGGLLSENDTRAAIAMALHELISTEDQPALHYINSSTNMQWDHDIHGNYGISVQELLFTILVERKYKMGLGVNPVSITEKIKVPTLQELFDILAAGKRAEEIADEWEVFMDFTRLEEMRDVMVEQGKQFFDNAIAGFREAGIDVEDPLEMILTLRKFNPVKFEQAFHSTSFNSEMNEIKPFYPTVLGRQTVEMKNEIIEELKEAGLEGPLKGKKIVVASGDAHTYGLILVESVLSDMGATVVNGGVDVDAVDILDLADEEDTRFVGISCHNGQALDYGRQLVQLAKDRGKEYWIFMGGKLNAILPGHSEPTEISHMLKALGIYAENDIKATVSQMSMLAQ